MVDQSEYNKIFKDALTYSTRQIDELKNEHRRRWTSLIIRPYTVDNTFIDPGEIFVYTAILNHFIGVFEGICFSKLIESTNFEFNSKCHKEYIKYVSPYFNKLKDNITKINIPTLKIIWENCDKNT